MDKSLCSASSLPHLAFDSLEYILNVSSIRDGLYGISFRMQIIFKLKNSESETTKYSELFTGQGLQGASLLHKY